MTVSCRCLHFSYLLKSSFTLGSKVLGLLLIVFLLFVTEVLGIYVVMAMLSFFPVSRINTPLISHLLGLKTESNRLKRKTLSPSLHPFFWGGERERNIEVRRREGRKRTVAERTLSEFWLGFFSPLLNKLNFYQLQISCMSLRYKGVLIF